MEHKNTVLHNKNRKSTKLHKRPLVYEYYRNNLYYSNSIHIISNGSLEAKRREIATKEIINANDKALFVKSLETDKNNTRTQL